MDLITIKRKWEGVKTNLAMDLLGKGQYTCSLCPVEQAKQAKTEFVHEVFWTRTSYHQ